MEHDPSYAVPYKARNGNQQWKPTLETVKQCDMEMVGFCLACGDNSTPCEPDGVKLECDNCGQPKVYGAQELALLGLVA